MVFEESAAEIKISTHEAQDSTRDQDNDSIELEAGRWASMQGSEHLKCRLFTNLGCSETEVGEEGHVSALPEDRDINISAPTVVKFDRKH